MSNAIRAKMTPYFQNLKGGLFDEIAKADVGDNADRMVANGVAMLSWADPFFPDDTFDSEIRDTLVRSLFDGTAQHYTTPIGNAKLKEAICQKLWEDNGLDTEPQRNIIITPGSDSALFFAMLPFVAPGDEVMIVDPSYPNNFQNVYNLKGVPVSIPTRFETGFELEIDEFEKRLTPKTKMILLTNPNNPTTVVYSRESMEKLAEFARKNDLLVIVDQAFEDIIFDDREMVTMVTLPGMKERTITVCSISKGLGLSGLRVGYIVASDVLIDVLYACAVSVIGASNSAAQLAAITAINKRHKFISEYKDIFDRRRKFVYDSLSTIPGVRMQMPQSSFLSWVDVSALGDSEEIVKYLIDEAKVFVNAGNYYGEKGNGYIRIVQGCYKNDFMLEAAILRIREALLKRSQELGLK